MSAHAELSSGRDLVRILRREEFKADPGAFLAGVAASLVRERETAELWRDHWGELFERHVSARRHAYIRNIPARTRQLERDFGMRVQLSGWGFP